MIRNSSDIWLVCLVVGITLLTGIVLIAFSYSLVSYSLCGLSDQYIHLFEIISNLFFFIPAIYAGVQYQWFVMLNLIGIFIASTLYHLCSEIDELSCSIECIWDQNSLYYCDLTLPSLLIYSLGFYRLKFNVESLNQKLLLALIPFILGGIFSAKTLNTTSPGWDSVEIAIYSVLFVVAVYVLWLRLKYNKYDLTVGHTTRSQIYFSLTILLAIIAFTLHFLQSTVGYSLVHSFWHCASGLAVFFYLLYIDERILEE